MVELVKDVNCDLVQSAHLQNPYVVRGDGVACETRRGGGGGGGGRQRKSAWGILGPTFMLSHKKSEKHIFH